MTAVLDLRPYVERPRKHANGTPIPVRLAARIDYRGDDVCWEWRGTTNNQGYGMCGVNRRQFLVHRLVYELLVGPIPDGLSLDHLCRNPPCCNPAHLEPVTHRENLLRGNTFVARNAVKTHCPRGHLYDEANTYRRAQKPTERSCRACHREAERRRKIRLHAELPKLRKAAS